MQKKNRVNRPRRRRGSRLHHFSRSVRPRRRRQLRRHTVLPLATGERLYTRWGFRDLLAEGAAGSVEAAITVLALQRGVLPPTINLENPDPECDLDYVPNTARKMPIDVALSNSFGFGGTNGSLIFRRFNG